VGGQESLFIFVLLFFCYRIILLAFPKRREPHCSSWRKSLFSANDKSSFLSTIHLQEARDYIRDGIISGGMIPKVEAWVTALECGAAKTHIIDGRLPHAIILEIFTSTGVGTQVVR